MNQLNNKSTGEIIELLSCNETGTAYNKFEDYATLSNPTTITDTTPLDKTFVPTTTMNINDITNTWATNKVLSLETGFAIATDPKNWGFANVSDGTNTMVADIRFFIPNDLILQSLQGTTPFTDLYNRMKPIIASFSTITKHHTIAYWNKANMNPNDMTLITTTYSGIIIVDNA